MRYPHILRDCALEVSKHGSSLVRSPQLGRLLFFTGAAALKVLADRRL